MFSLARLMVGRVEAFAGGLFLLLVPLVFWANLGSAALALGVLGVLFTLQSFRALSRLYGESRAWDDVRQAVIMVGLGLLAFYVSSLYSIIVGGCRFRELTLIPSTVNAIGSLSVFHLLILLASYALILAGALKAWRGLEILAYKSREGILRILASTIIASAVLLSLTLSTIALGVILIVLAIHGKPRAP